MIGLWRTALYASSRTMAFAVIAFLPQFAIASECRLKSSELPVTIEGQRVVTRVRIYGVQVPLVVDSGAFFSFLTEGVARQLYLDIRSAPDGFNVQGVTGAVETRMTTVPHVELMGSEIPNLRFIVGGNEPGSGARGLLGRNILAAADTEYDLAHGVIRLVTPEGDCGNGGMAYWAKDAPVSELPLSGEGSRELYPAIRVKVQLEGTEVDALLDTGAPTSVVWLSAARKAGVTEASMTPAGVSYGMGHDEARSWIASVPRLQIGAESIQNNRLRIADFQSGGSEMLLGLDFFLSHRIYVSRQQRRMYFTYNGGQVFALNAPVPSDSPDDGPLADAHAYSVRAAVKAARGDFVYALADLDRACAMSPQSSDLLVQRGKVHESLEHGSEALRDFDIALRADPARDDARLERARLRLDARDRDGAMTDVQLLDRRLPYGSDARRGLARLYARLDMPGFEIAQLDVWVNSHPNEHGMDSVLAERCWARLQLGTYLDKALADCEKAVEQRPGNSSYLVARAWVRLRLGARRDAIADYNEALALQPEDAWATYGRGIARTLEGDAEGGSVDLAAARKREPAIEKFAQRLGLVAASAAPSAAGASSATR